MRHWLWPLLLLALVASIASAQRLTTFAWDADPNWPPGTTIELCGNGDVCLSGITGTQATLDLPVQPGAVIEGRARAIPPPGHQCGEPLATCPPSKWATVAQTWPASGTNLTVRFAPLPLPPTDSEISMTRHIEETFEGTGAPSGWYVSNGGDGIVDFDYTDAPLSGSKSLRMVNASSEGSYAIDKFLAAASAINKGYFYFQFKLIDPPNNNEIQIGTEILQTYYVTDDISIVEPQLLLRVTNGRVLGAQWAGSTSQTLGGSTALTLGTVYHVFGYFSIPTANARNGWIKISTDGVRPSTNEIAFDSWNPGNSYSSIDAIGFTTLRSSMAGPYEFVVDNLIVDDDPIFITDDPNIDFIGSGAQAVSTTSGGSVTAAWPAGYTAVANDVAVLIGAGMHNNGTSLAPSDPSGWTQVATRFREVGTYDLQLTVWIKKLSDSESAPQLTVPAAYSTTSGGLSAQVAVYRGVDSATLQDATAVASDAAAAASFQPTGITTATDGAMVLSIVASADDNALRTSISRDFAERMYGAGWDTTTGGDHAVGMADRWVASAGAVSSPTWLQTSVGTDAWAGITLALKPAGIEESVTLTVGNSVHAHAAQAPALTQAHALAVQNSVHGHLAQALNLSASVTLSVDPAQHSHTAQLLDLLQAHALAVQNSLHGHLAADIGLTQAHVLTTAGSVHGHSATAPTLTAGGSLTVANAVHAHVAQGLSLAQAHAMAVQGSLHGHSAQPVTLTQAHVLEPAASVHGHSAQTADLSQAHVLATASSIHDHASQSLELTQAHILDSAASVHGHTSEPLNLTQAHALAVQNSVHGHLLQSLELSTGQTLSVGSTVHAHVCQGLSLTQAHQLAILNSAHGHASQSLELTQAHVLAPASSIHGHVAESPTLSTAFALNIASAAHGHIAQSLALTQAHVLDLQGSVHGHVAAGVALIQGFALIVGDSVHGHAATPLTLDQSFVLAIQNAVHQHHAAALELATQVTLVVSDAMHGHFVTAAADLALPPGDRIFVVEAEDRVFVVIPDDRIFVV